MNIDEMSKQFRSIEELQAYANSQFRTIVEQSKKIHSLEEEVIHLKKLLEDGTQVIKDPSKKIELYTDVSDQEAICRIELKKLKDLSIERDLTLEEAKRVDIYTKLILSLTAATKSKSTEIITPERLDDAKLLALLADEVEVNGNNQ